MRSADNIVVLTRDIAAVKLGKPGERMGPLCRIPEHARVRVVGRSDAGGMIEIDWHGERYAVFEQDLRARAVAEDDGDDQGFVPRLFG